MWTGRIPDAVLADARLDRFRIEIQRHRINVTEDRVGSLVEQTVGGGDKAERTGQDLISRAPPERSHAEVQGGRAARHGDSVLDPEPGRELALEAIPHWSQRELA